VNGFHSKRNWRDAATHSLLKLTLASVAVKIISRGQIWSLKEEGQAPTIHAHYGVVMVDGRKSLEKACSDIYLDVPLILRLASVLVAAASVATSAVYQKLPTVDALSRVVVFVLKKKSRGE